MGSASVSSYGLSNQQVSSLNAFIENLYRHADDPAAHSEYISQFLPNATLILNHTTVEGEEAITSLRKLIWSSCLSQKHVVERVIYIQEPSAKTKNINDHIKVETTLFGTVTTESKTGGQRKFEWAGRAEYVSKNDTEWKISQYQIYLNTEPRNGVKL